MTNIADSTVRRRAKLVGLLARKSRWRRGSSDNCGGYMLLDPISNAIVGGARSEKFALTAEEVTVAVIQRLDSPEFLYKIIREEIKKMWGDQEAD